MFNMLLIGKPKIMARRSVFLMRMCEMTKSNDGAPAGADGVQTGTDRTRTTLETGHAEKAAKRLREEDLERIIEYINDIRYGSVTVIIQDGHVLQIEKNEKIRLK
jgi:hypothetical protein